MSSKLLPMRAADLGREDFRRACGRFATGVTVATMIGTDGAPHGMTVNSFTSVSLEPPLVLFCVDHRAGILEHARACEFFGINVLTEDQRYLSELFARKGRDRFDGVPWQPGETGVPLLPEALATFECSLERIVTAGDHDILIGQVLYVTVREGRPLLYFGSQYRELE